MAGERDQLRVRKPESLLTAELRFDLMKAIPGLAEGALRTALRMEKAEDALVRGVAALGVNAVKTPGERAWLLITQALVRAATRTALNALTAKWDEPAATWKQRLASLGAELVTAQDAALQEAQYLVSPALLDRPREIPGVTEARAPLAAWLEQEGVAVDEARKAAAALPEQFVHALYQEWIANPAEAKGVEDALKSGMAAAAQREWAWSRYRAHLWAEYQKPLFGSEKFGRQLSLPDLYIPLRGYYTTRDRTQPVRRSAPEDLTETKHVVWAEECLDHWLADSDASRVRVIGGGPGAGKSSFLRRYAALVSERRDRPVVFVELHLADVDGDLPALLESYLRRSGLLGFDPLNAETGERRLLVILDGLDELERAGRPGQEAARRVLKEARRFTELRELGRQDIRVLLSGREVVVSAVCKELNQPEQVIHLLPYRASAFLGQPQLPEELKADQRDEWWVQLRHVSGRSDEMPPGLDEITAEPLLNYLVALAQASGRLSADEEVNLNQVYEALVLDVWENAWGGYRRPKPKQAEFFAVLEEVAVASWHGDGKGATIAAIRQRCETVKLGHVLDALQKEAEAGVVSLLVAFFFQERDRDDDHNCTFEFTHRSFAEYLLARRLVFAVEQIHEECEKERKAGARVRDGWSKREALVHWAELCGPTLLSQNAAKFLYRELLLQKVESASAWQQTLTTLATVLVHSGGLPMEEVLPKGLAFPEMLRRARNAEAALLVGLAACANYTDEPSKVSWPHPGTLRHWLEALSAAEWPILLVSTSGLVGITAHEARLNGTDLVNANLSRVDLSGSDLSFADLTGTNMSGANLANAMLWGASLRNAFLHGARLEGAHFGQADLSQALLPGANLCHANLPGADLSGAHLRRADLSGADLHGADLRLADLIGARYDSSTLWPVGFDPGSRGAVMIE